MTNQIPDNKSLDWPPIWGAYAIVNLKASLWKTDWYMLHIHFTLTSHYLESNFTFSKFRLFFKNFEKNSQGNEFCPSSHFIWLLQLKYLLPK